MKRLLIRGALTAFLGLAVASMSAQTQNTTSGTTYIEASKIVGNRVKSSDGQEVGTIKDVVLDRNTGCMAYTVVSSAGGGPSVPGGKMVAVPWAVYSPTSNVSELTVTVDRERIYNAPVFDYARIDEYSRPEYITNVYSYYGVSPAAGVGVGVSGSTTAGATTTTGSTTATGATAGTNQAGAASNSATGSQGAEASPTTHGRSAVTARATPTDRRHPVASRNTRGEEETIPPNRKTRAERGRSEEGSAARERGETGSRTETEPPRNGGSSQAEGGAATRESDSEREQSRPQGASEAEGGPATRESRPEREQSAPEGSSRTENGTARESHSEREQSRPEGATQGEMQTGRHRPEKAGKRETRSPSERPQGE